MCVSSQIQSVDLVQRPRKSEASEAPSLSSESDATRDRRASKSDAAQNQRACAGVQVHTERRLQPLSPPPLAGTSRDPDPDNEDSSKRSLRKCPDPGGLQVWVPGPGRIRRAAVLVASRPSAVPTSLVGVHLPALVSILSAERDRDFTSRDIIAHVHHDRVQNGIRSMVRYRKRMV